MKMACIFWLFSVLVCSSAVLADVAVTVSEGTAGDDVVEVSLAIDGGAVAITLLDEFFEPVDTLLIEGPLTVLSPNGGEVLAPGYSWDITWAGTEQIESVDIDYSLDNGGLWQPVVADANNNGLYVWNPIPVANSSQCLIRISDGGDPNVFDISDNPFEISECFSNNLGNYAEWVQFGRPDCWCYPYNCKGDADGTWEGTTKTGYKRVYLRDLNWLTRCYNIKEPPKGPGVGSIPGCICADFARDAEGTSKTALMRVYVHDLIILSTYYNVADPPKGPGLMMCPASPVGEIIYYKSPDHDIHIDP
jgi:hypothetical protein